MTPTSVTLDLAGRLRTPTACPACGAEGLDVENDGDRLTLLCRVCHRCWDPGFGWMSPVDPRACRDCAERSGCLHHARAWVGP